MIGHTSICTLFLYTAISFFSFLAIPEASGLALGCLILAGFVLDYDMMICDTIFCRQANLSAFSISQVYFLRLNSFRYSETYVVHRPYLVVVKAIAEVSSADILASRRWLIGPFSLFQHVA